ncbi:MAG: IS200/IS605 family transposase [Syntrophobacteraceae bacterium]
MPQSLSQVHLHIIFSTKNRRAYLKPEGLRTEMHAFLSSVMREFDSPALVIGGIEDHVHILCMLSRTHAVAKIVGEVKRRSSKWIKTKDRSLEFFHWQNGYGAFSVSFSKTAEVQEYILNQSKHHEKMSFQEEYRRFLHKHGVDFDENYVWD